MELGRAGARPRVSMYALGCFAHLESKALDEHLFGLTQPVDASRCLHLLFAIGWRAGGPFTACHVYASREVIVEMLHERMSELPAPGRARVPTGRPAMLP